MIETKKMEPGTTLAQAVASISEEIRYTHEEILTWRKIAHDFKEDLTKDDLAIEKSHGLLGHLQGLQRALHLLLKEPSLRTEECLEAAWLELPGEVFFKIEKALLGSPDDYPSDHARNKAYGRRRESAASALGIDLATYNSWCSLGAPMEHQSRVQALAAKLKVRSNREIYGEGL